LFHQRARDVLGRRSTVRGGNDLDRVAHEETSDELAWNVGTAVISPWTGLL
jgi:hypothetical protein